MVGVVYVIPLVANGVMAFTDWSGFKSGIDWIGVQNFADLAARNAFVRPVTLTMLYAFTAMVLQNGVGVALALEETSPINSLFRSVFFFPVLLSSVAAAYLWRGLLQPNGPVNALIGAVLPGEFDFAWLGSTTLAIFVVGAIDGWKWLGFATLVYIAGLKSVPEELKQAARVDGATPAKVFWHIKRPLLAPAFTFNVTITFIGSLSAFETILATTRGGPGDATRVLNIMMLRQFGSGFFGLAASITLMLTVLIIVIAIPLVWWLRSRELEL
jgi:multiple sugar transport system permease protein/raffinose/stachyose/melibiose transport system permease protein